MLAIAWKVPHGVGIGYLVLSTVCFVAYAADKSAARSGAWRIRENTLLLLGLLGGWPGAVLAQQWLRHKSAKPSFRNAFWLTVVVNIALFMALSSPRWYTTWARPTSSRSSVPMLSGSLWEYGQAVQHVSHGIEASPLLAIGLDHGPGCIRGVGRPRVPRPNSARSCFRHLRYCAAARVPPQCPRAN